MQSTNWASFPKPNGFGRDCSHRHYRNHDLLCHCGNQHAWFPQLTSILETVLAQAGNVVFGAVLIALGVLIANILRNLIADATGPGIASNVTYWITTGLFVFIGLNRCRLAG